jgi:hypoxanthine phosphoribosyltransferase
MKIHGSDLMPDGRYALVRDGKVAMIGPVSNLSDHYQPGDIVCVNTQAYEAIKEAVETAERYAGDRT